MEVVVCETPAEVASAVGHHVCKLVQDKPTAVIGFATGRSPVLTYHDVIRRAALNGVNFAKVQAVMLDEYLGLSDDHESLFRNVLRPYLREMGIADDHLLALPNQFPDDEHAPVDEGLRERCDWFEKELERLGGVDLQLLGIGAGGHIGFNEPTSSLSSRTRVKTLSPETKVANAPSFAKVEWLFSEGGAGPRILDGHDGVPVHVVTQGIGTILESKHVILIATGSEKAPIVAKAVEGPITALVPASALQLHRHATVVIDEEAAQDLELLDYYREIQKTKRYIQPRIT